MKKIINKITTYEVVIKEIVIDDRYYTIKYDFWIDGVLKTKNGEYNDDHVRGHEKNDFMKVLEDGFAVENVIERDLH